MNSSHIMFVLLMTTLCIVAKEKPRADVFLRVTSDLPKWSSDTGYSGYFSVTNTGTVPFVIITDEEWSGEVTWFYREGDGEQQLMEDLLGGGCEMERRRTRKNCRQLLFQHRSEKTTYNIEAKGRHNFLL